MDNNIKPLTPEIESEISQFKEESILFGLKDTDKLEQFEKLLSGQLRFSDSVQDAVSKMVMAALVSEFGSKILEGSKSNNMVRAISQGILSDGELRKQALLVIDRFAKADELNA